MKAKDLKNIKLPLNLCGKNFMIAFDFNALAELEEVYDEGFEKAMRSIQQGKGRIKTIRALIYAAIKPRNPKITLIEVGEMLTECLSDEEKFNYVVDTLMKAVDLAIPNDEEVEEINGDSEGE